MTSLFVQNSSVFVVVVCLSQFRLPKLSEADKTKLIKFVVDGRNRKAVAKMYCWFLDEGHIKEDVLDVAENSNTKTQEDEFYNPEPGSKYWEPHWPKGNFIFYRICVATMILHACV